MTSVKTSLLFKNCCARTRNTQGMRYPVDLRRLPQTAFSLTQARLTWHGMAWAGPTRQPLSVTSPRPAGLSESHCFARRRAPPPSGRPTHPTRCVGGERVAPPLHARKRQRQRRRCEAKIPLRARSCRGGRGRANGAGQGYAVGMRTRFRWAGLFAVAAPEASPSIDLAPPNVSRLT
jgi:hypothetical protein